MAHWLFVCTRKQSGDKTIEAREILSTRLADRFWGLRDKTARHSALKKGDQVIFYIGQPDMAFAATATLSRDLFELTPEEQVKYSHGSDLYTVNFGVTLEDIRTWEPPQPVQGMLGSLRFIENKAKWFVHFQCSFKELSEEDFNWIAANRPSGPAKPTACEVTADSDSQFQLEKHLEEFIDNNWDRIDFGSLLKRYKLEDQNGRQFPAGQWKIDFLCIDSSNDDLVVIELKRGKTSDATIGQILRYIGWVTENLAKPNQKVRGIIILQEADDALRCAVGATNNVSVLTYQVDFKLAPLKD